MTPNEFLLGIQVVMILVVIGTIAWGAGVLCGIIANHRRYRRVCESTARIQEATRRIAR